MRPTLMMTMFACLCAAACSRNDTSGTETTNTHAPGSNALNNNPSGATPMTNDPSGVAPTQPPSADGVQFAGAGHEAGAAAMGGGPTGAGAGDVAAERSDAGASMGAGSGAAGAKGAKADDKGSCPGGTDVRVGAKNGGFCARACRSDIDCAPKGKCDGVGETSAKGYSQPNGKYCTGM